ncbi:MAG: hypothetical protein ACR2NZ_11575 [Rubripirellula sp.]
MASEARLRSESALASKRRAEAAFAAQVQRCSVEVPLRNATAQQALAPPISAQEALRASTDNEGPVRWLRSSSSSANAEVSRQLIEQANREYRTGAWLSAESTAWEALRWAAEGIDLSDRETAKTHLGVRVNHSSELLRIARDAIREARDFSGAYGTINAEAITRMALSHSTDVLDEVPTHGLTGTDAADRYLDEARVALAGIAERSVEAAQSMDLLAAIHLGQADARKLPSSTALCLRRAALQGQPKNASLASRLGMHLADVGLLDEARWALEHSLAMEHDGATADALVAVLRRSGRGEQAVRVLASIQNRSQSNTPDLGPRIPEITELSPSEFASISKPTMNVSRSGSVNAMLASSRKSTGVSVESVSLTPKQSVLDDASASQDKADGLESSQEPTSEKKPGVIRRMMSSLKRVW